MLDPRKRALEALALGGAVPSTEEVDVATVPTAAVPPSVRNDMKAPVPDALTTGDPQGATERDYYADALSEKHRRQFEQSLSGVGSGILQAFTGVGPSQDTLRQRQDYAEEPLVSYMRQQAEADKDRALDISAARKVTPSTLKAQLSTDPTSPASRAAQARWAPFVKDQLTPEEIALIPEADWKGPTGALDTSAKGRTAEVTREGHVGADKRASAALEQRTKEHIEEMGFKWENLSHQDQRAYMALEEARIYRDQARADRQQEQLDTDVTNLGKDLEDVGAMRDDLMTLRSGAFKSDIPGVGLIDARKPGFMQGPADVAVRQAVRGIVSRLLKAQSGSTVSEQELDRKLEELGMGDSATEQQFRSGLARLERDVTTTLTSREARHKPEAVKTYKGRGGITSGDMPPPGPTRNPATNALPKDSTGQPTLDVPKPAKVQYSPSRDMTRELDAAGNVIREYKGRPNG